MEQLETLLDWLGTNLDQSGQSGPIWTNFYQSRSVEVSHKQSRSVTVVSDHIERFRTVRAISGWMDGMDGMGGYHDHYVCLEHLTVLIK